MEQSLSRSELYDLVWTRPLSKLAPRFGVSDVGLAKICFKYRVPRPWRGYWAQRAAGKRIRRPKLPALRPDEEQSLGTIKFKRRAERAEATGPVAEQERYEAQHPIRVPKRLSSKPHPLVQGTRGWYQAESGSRMRQSTQRLDLRVDRKSLSRALRIMDTLLKALERRGFRVIAKAGEKPRTIVKVNGAELCIRLEERRRQVRIPPSTADQMLAGSDSWMARSRLELEYTGQLVLRIDQFWPQNVRKSWGDGKRQRVEDLLNRFIVGFVRAAEAKKAQDREWEERRRLREEAERRRLEEIRRAEEQRRRAEQLATDAALWAKAQQIREFVAAVRDGAIKEGRVSDGLSEWVAWAEDQVAQLDPLEATIARLWQGPSETVSGH